MNSPASLKAQERTSRSWLVTFQNGSDSGQIKKPEFTSWWLKFFFPFPEHGSSRWKAWSQIRDCEAVEACEKSHNQLLQEASIQTECFFFFNFIALT